MGLIIGPTPWWQASLVSACPVGTTLPDGGKIICKAGGTAWIVAPACTEVCTSWPGIGVTVGDKCCVCDWPALCSRMISCGFNPNDWCVPSQTNLLNPGYSCRTNWDSFSSAQYWSSTEINATTACSVNFSNGAGISTTKSTTWCVRPIRTVTY
jgi:hypothetical protein